MKISRKFLYSSIATSITAAIVLYLIWFWIKLVLTFSDFITKILLAFFITLSIISTFLIYYQIFSIRRVEKKSIVYMILYILGIGSIQGCVALFCNPGFLFSIIAMIIPTVGGNFFHNIEIMKYILLGTDIILLITIYFSIRGYVNSKKLKIKLDIKKASS